MKIKKEYLLLFFVLFLAFLIRMFRLTDYPEGFYQNEASFGYNAYSILKTGRDEYGRLLPFVLESFGDYKLAGFSYWLIPFILIFGLSEFSVRLGVVIASIVLLVILYFLTREVFTNKKISLFTTYLTAILPWSLVFSRTANETIVAVMWFMISMYFFVLYQKRKKFFLILGAVLNLILSIISHYSSWIPVLFIILIEIVSTVKFFSAKSTKLFVYLFIIVMPVIVMFYISYTNTQRIRQINVFEHSRVNALLQEQIREDQRIPPLIFTRTFHNKITAYFRYLSSSFFSTFNYNFFFSEGDTGEKVYKVPQQGVLFLWFLPLFLLGNIYFWHKYPKRFAIFAWVFIGVVFGANSFSQYGSESQRTLISLPIFSLITSFGLVVVYKRLKRHKTFRIFNRLFLIVFVYELAYFYHQYFFHVSIHEPWYRNVGSREMVKTVDNLKSRYNKVIISGNPYIFFYFYNKIDPYLAQLESNDFRKELDALNHPIRYKVGDYFIMPVDCPVAGKINILYVCKGVRISPNSRVIKVIYFKDDQPSYTFIEFTKDKEKKILPKSIELFTSGSIISEDKDYDWLDEKGYNKIQMNSDYF